MSWTGDAFASCGRGFIKVVGTVTPATERSERTEPTSSADRTSCRSRLQLGGHSYRRATTVLEGHKLLAIVLVIDALLSAGFGLTSYFLPQSTYATIVDLRGVPEHSLQYSILGSLSVFYVVIGAVCFVSVFMPSPHGLRVAAVMMAQHAWIGIRGVAEMNRAWIVGNPWPDIVIHALFVIAYATGVLWSVRCSTAST